jgi:hypothetical protein
MPLGLARDTPNPEIALAIGTVAVALLAARFRFPWLGWWERPLANLGRKKKLAILLSGVAPLIVRAALLPLFPIPEPRVHDEFTHLLAADTFLHGRVANPQHPFWMHFQSPHILSRPVYASAFPMAQGALLALGKLLGNPWVGVLLSSGFMCAAICWMLQGWVPPRWALLGAILAIVRFGVSSYWMNSYWGGCVAAIGGALVLGSIPRIVRSPTWRRALPFGVGLAILANSRPVEGAVFGLVCAVVLAAWMIQARRFAVGTLVRQIVLPLSLILAVTGIGMGYAFARVTGKPWVMPYFLYRESVTIAPHFIWQSPRPEPLYSNRELRRLYVYSEMANYATARTLGGVWEKAGAYWRFYVGPLLAIPLLAALFLLGTRLRRNRKTRWALLISAGFLLAIAGQVWHNAHYAAPATGLVILIVIQGMRALRLWRPLNLSFGLSLVRVLPVACAAMLVLQIAIPPHKNGPHASWRWPLQEGVTRARVIERLRATGAKHLVFVRYSTSHDLGDEWVYNDADIDNAQVVWARELDPESNARLMKYFSGRQTWLLDPDDPRPLPYADAPFRPMHFVQIGAPGIEVLRSADQIKAKMLAIADAHGTMRSCESWNFYFTRATGVGPPQNPTSCFAGGDHDAQVSLDYWLDWLKRQR